MFGRDVTMSASRARRAQAVAQPGVTRQVMFGGSQAASGEVVSAAIVDDGRRASLPARATTRRRRAPAAASSNARGLLVSRALLGPLAQVAFDIGQLRRSACRSQVHRRRWRLGDAPHATGVARRRRSRRSRLRCRPVAAAANRSRRAPRPCTGAGGAGTGAGATTCDRRSTESSRSGSNCASCRAAGSAPAPAPCRPAVDESRRGREWPAGWSAPPGPRWSVRPRPRPAAPLRSGRGQGSPAPTGSRDDARARRGRCQRPRRRHRRAGTLPPAAQKQSTPGPLGPGVEVREFVDYRPPRRRFYVTVDADRRGRRATKRVA